MDTLVLNIDFAHYDQTPFVSLKCMKTFSSSFKDIDYGIFDG